MSLLDGLNQTRQIARDGTPSRSRQPSPASTIVSVRQYTPSTSPSPPPTAHSHVQFGPLSPQSSQTLLRLRQTRSRDNVDQDDGDHEPRRLENNNGSDDDHENGTADSAVVPRRRFRKRRRNSDPSANRPLVTRHRDGPVESDRSSSEEEIEVLPDRFDNQGRPINSGSASRSGDGGRWTERRGDFVYRSPRPGGTQVRGAWGVAGTDPEQVERVVRDMSGVLAGEMPKGMGGWLGLAGRLLGGVMAHGATEGVDDGEDEDRDRRRGGTGYGHARGDRRQERGAIGYGDESSEISRDERGKGRRRSADHGYFDEGDEGLYDEEREEARRRRRRRRRREEGGW